MTEPIFPDRLADELLTGAADRASLPADVRGLADVLAAAQQAPVDEELAGMTAAVAAFQGMVTPPVSAPGDSTTPRRVTHMFSTRIPKRAAVIVAATLLCAGTAAAAAGGAIPSPFPGSERAQEVIPTSSEASTSSTDATTSSTEASTSSTDSSTSSTDASTSSTDASTSSTDAATDGATATTVYPGRDFGLCTAWTHGAAKPLNPAFQYLADQAAADAAAGAPEDPNAPVTSADEAAVRAGVDSYCDKVITDKQAQQADDATDAPEATEAPDAEDAADATEGTRPAQAGKSGQHGKAGQHGKP